MKHITPSFTIYEPTELQQVVVRFNFSKPYHDLDDERLKAYQEFYLALKVVQKSRIRGKHLRRVFLSSAVSQLVCTFKRCDFPVYVHERKLGKKLRAITNAIYYHTSLINSIAASTMYYMFAGNARLASYNVNNLRGVKNSDSVKHTRLYTEVNNLPYEPNLDDFACSPQHKRMFIDAVAAGMPDCQEFDLIKSLIAQFNETSL